MEELFSHPNFWLAVVAFILIQILFIRVYIRIRNGGLYYRKYPVAASMDRMKKAGNLTGKDIESAMMSVDPSAPKADQVKSFESAIDAQK